MIRHISFFILIISILIVLGKNIPAQTVVGKFGKHQITLAEFEKVYAKNVGGSDVAKEHSFQQYKDFMQLYMKFRMKLRNAKVRGFDKDPELEKELKDYQEQVGRLFITEKNIILPGVRDLYEKRKEELRVSHIMFKPANDKRSMQFANAILDSINNGASFEQMAAIYSQDKFSGLKGGDIYFVTAGSLPIEFEDAIYTLNEGEVYQSPVETIYGYHLIKVTKKQSRVPKIRASHILIDYQNNNGEIDSASARLTADSILAQLKNDADFTELARKYSEDTSTKERGGDLGFFERRQMVQPFDEVAFSLNEGEISDVVETNFGYHIIKLIQKQPYSSFDDEYENLKKIYQKQRYDIDYKKYLNALRNKYNVTLDTNTVNIIVENCDSSRFGEDYFKIDVVTGKELFNYGSNIVYAEEFITEMNNNPDFTGKAVFDKTEVMKAVNKLIEDRLLKHYSMNLHKENEDFAFLMDEYKQGVYIFKLQEDEVWNKLKVDSAQVYNYWEENKENYTWPDRIEFGEIFTTRDSLAKVYYDMLLEGTDFDSLAALYTERPGKKKVSGRYELQDVDFSDLSRTSNTLVNVGNFTNPVEISGGYSIFYLHNRELARIKSFEEARAEVTGDFQEVENKRLEKEFLNKLDKIYEPVIYYDELKKAFK
ncbi:MAG: peptidylprolyl isomerase [Ignavibacteria bacterium]|jgi:peptidyl-prolyl cis-trans isomerase SurA